MFWIRSMSMLAALVFAGSLAVAHQVETPTLRIGHPNTIEPSDPSIQDAVVVMTIENKSKEADRLIAVSCTLAREAIVVSGSSPEKAAIELPSGKKTVLTKKGPRIELRGLAGKLTGYETFKLTATFEKAGNVDIEVLVESADDVHQEHQH